MSMTLSYITDRDRKNEYSWDEWCLWVVYSSCLASGILAVSSLGGLVWFSRDKDEGKNKRGVKSQRNIPSTTENE
jgi:hypothetical protein